MLGTLMLVTKFVMFMYLKKEAEQLEQTGVEVQAVCASKRVNVPKAKNHWVERYLLTASFTDRGGSGEEIIGECFVSNAIYLRLRTTENGPVTVIHSPSTPRKFLLKDHVDALINRPMDEESWGPVWWRANSSGSLSSP